MSSLNVRYALEAAVNAIAPIIPAATISTSSVAAATVITTSAAHGLTTGQLVTIAGHSGSTPSINGVRKITKLSANTFSIPVAVTVAGTGGTVTANLTAWENMDFVPITGVPYQACSLNFAAPDNPEYGASYFEQGFLQINVVYPLNAGAGAAATRAELIRSTFKRGNTYLNGGITTLITHTPQIMTGYPTATDFVIPVRVRFRAQIPVS